jgi:hypothetical protein
MTTPNNPTKYLGPNQYLNVVVIRNREPTGADVIQPETGKYYQIGTVWQVGKNPTTGSEGDLWMLSKIVANVSYWDLISSGGIGTESFVTNLGGPVVPDDDAEIFVNASVSTFTDGTVANTLKTEVQATNHQLLIGRGTNVAASTISNGTSTFVLTSNGASADPSFQVLPALGSFNQVTQQVFTSSGTYTPTTGMKYCIVRLVGAGGGGGGANTGGVGTACVGGGGGAGGYAESAFSAATIGVSQTVTIGAAGTAGTNVGGDGGSGGTTSLGALISATGGTGGIGSPTDSGGNAQNGSPGGTGSGTVSGTGAPGGTVTIANIAGAGVVCVAGFGGSTIFGAGGQPRGTVSGGAFAGIAGSNGGGGSGGICNGNSGGAAGGAGGAGYMVITEFLSL